MMITESMRKELLAATFICLTGSFVLIGQNVQLLWRGESVEMVFLLGADDMDTNRRTVKHGTASQCAVLPEYQ